MRLLTRELLDVLARFIHATDERFDQVEGRLQVVEYDIVQLKADVSYLKGTALETTLHRKIIPRISQTLGLRRAEIKVSPLQGIEPTFRDTIEDGVDNGLISDEQMGRVFETDLILRAIRRDTRSSLWVAVEASHEVREHDISRAVDTARFLGRCSMRLPVPWLQASRSIPKTHNGPLRRARCTLRYRRTKIEKANLS